MSARAVRRNSCRSNCLVLAWQFSNPLTGPANGDGAVGASVAPVVLYVPLNMHVLSVRPPWLTVELHRAN